MRRKIRKVEKNWRRKIGKIGGGKQGKLETENRENWRRKTKGKIMNKKKLHETAKKMTEKKN